MEPEPPERSAGICSAAMSDCTCDGVPRHVLKLVPDSGHAAGMTGNIARTTPTRLRIAGDQPGPGSRFGGIASSKLGPRGPAVTDGAMVARVSYAEEVA